MTKKDEEKSASGELIDLIKEKLNDLLNIVKINETDSPGKKIWKRVLSLPVAVFIICLSPFVILTLLIAFAIAF